ncbi:hypothetical protein [Frankia gtarii]|uniref:hypothetical protein n=1 Tax=Frankia gtarii TaxID=2950102 RepID=UPI0021C03F68|nr:hypothetical protein [Frankia gtarii]
MLWQKGSGTRLALHGEPPVCLEDLTARLRRAAEIRCSDRGWNPAARLEPGVMAKLFGGDDAITDVDLGNLYELPSAPELVDLDDALEWVRGSAEKVALTGVDPIPLEGGPTQVVIQLDEPPGAVDLTEWFLVSGRAQATAPQMTPEERGKLTAVLQNLLDTWLESHG